jgi:hypothetical protein
MGKWVVCPTCEGEGTVDNLGAFTGDDLDREFGHGEERDEFIENYKNGLYRNPCPTCKARTTISLEELEAWQDAAESRAIQAAEIAAGA